MHDEQKLPEIIGHEFLQMMSAYIQEQIKNPKSEVSLAKREELYRFYSRYIASKVPCLKNIPTSDSKYSEILKYSFCTLIDMEETKEKILEGTQKMTLRQANDLLKTLLIDVDKETNDYILNREKLKLEQKLLEISVEYYVKYSRDYLEKPNDDIKKLDSQINKLWRYREVILRCSYSEPGFSLKNDDKFIKELQTEIAELEESESINEHRVELNEPRIKKTITVGDAFTQSHHQEYMLIDRDNTNYCKLVEKLMQNDHLMKTIVEDNTIAINANMLESCDQLQELKSVLKEKTGVPYRIDSSMSKKTNGICLLKPDIFDRDLWRVLNDNMISVSGKFGKLEFYSQKVNNSYKIFHEQYDCLDSCFPELIKKRISILKCILKYKSNFDYNCSRYLKFYKNIMDVFRLVDENKINSLKQKFPKVFDFNGNSISELNKNNEDDKGGEGNKVQKNKGVDYKSVK